MTQLMFSPEELQQVTCIFKALDQLRDVAGHEKRKAPRSGFAAAHGMLLHSLPACTKHKIFPRDISRTGIGFLCRRPFKPSEQFAISLPQTAEQDRLVLCQTVFCRYTTKSMHEVGAFFVAAHLSPTGAIQLPMEWIERAASGVPQAQPKA